MLDELRRTTLLSAIYEHLQLLRVYRSWLRAPTAPAYTTAVQSLHDTVLVALEQHEAAYRQAFEGRDLGEDLRRFAKVHRRRPGSGD